MPEPYFESRSQADNDSRVNSAEYSQAPSATSTGILDPYNAINRSLSLTSTTRTERPASSGILNSRSSASSHNEQCSVE